MLYNKTLIITILASLCTSYLPAEIKTTDLDKLDGNWHLRIMDDKEVRNARAILDFDSEKMTLNGFDGCNQISGVLQVVSDTNMTSKLVATKMACREPIHAYVSKRLHETLAEGFTVTEATQNGIKGITIKSSNHELFFKKMGKDDTSSWMSFDFDFDFNFDFNKTK